MFWLVALIVILPFGSVLLFGAPYLPTRKKQANQALDLLDLKKGELLVDLGCGDGAVLIEAARRGVRSVGYELNPIVFAVAYARTMRYRKLVKLHLQNYWNQPLPKDTKGVFVFLLDKYMAKLDKKCTNELDEGAKLVSHAFEIPGKKPRFQVSAFNLYIY